MTSVAYSHTLSISRILGRLDCARGDLADLIRLDAPGSLIKADLDILDGINADLEALRVELGPAQPQPLADLKAVRPADFDTADFNPEDCTEEWKKQEAVLRALGIEPGEAHHLTFMVGYWRGSAAVVR